MIDTSMVDVHSTIDRYTRVGKQEATTHGGEHWAACPFCGTGENRFHVWPNRPQDDGPCWWCRVCGRSGDIISFIEQVEHVDFLGACDILNVPIEGTYAPRQRQWHQQKDDEPPTDTWQNAASKFARECKETLWSDEGKPAMAWLRKRGLTAETIESAGLGYNGVNRFDTLEDWGLTKECGSKAVWLPRGIVIPWLIDRQLWKVSIRRGDKDLALDVKEGRKPKKYVAVKGGSNGLYGVATIKPNEPLFVFEGEFDQLIFRQELNRALAAVATGSTDKGREERWAVEIAQASPILVGFDYDAGGNEAFSEYWESHIPDAIRWVPWSHDVNEMYLAGTSLKQWAEAGLEVAGLPEWLTPVPPVELVAGPTPVAPAQVASSLHSFKVFTYPRGKDGNINWDKLAVMMPPLLPDDQVPQSFNDNPCIRCGDIGKACRRCDGAVLCHCFWLWYAKPAQKTLDGGESVA